MPKNIGQGGKLRLLLAASEVVGFAKTGGLADVAGALPRALARHGHCCAVIMPLYRCARTGKIPVRRTELTFAVPVGNRSVPGRLWQAALPDADVPVYLVDQPEYFDRDDAAEGRGLYQTTLPNGQKRDYPDNCERFAFFSRAVLEVLPLLNLRPDVIHANDWQTGLVPVYLKEVYRHRPGYEAVRTLFTIHNVAYQGIFRREDMAVTGLDWRLFNYRQLEFYGWLNLLKAGIVFADAISTVSPRYAREIQTPYFGCGLEGVLSENRDHLYGIVNGVDYRDWDPAADPHLAARYDVETVVQGKPRCKAALQQRYGLAVQQKAPLLAMIARLVDQKGVDLLVRAADALIEDGMQIVVLGEGDPNYHRMLLNLRACYPDRVGLTLGFDEPLAHHIEAGADIYLMPSLYEPAGLNQLYSLKYGTVPVVRATGGLYDTITDCTPETVAAGTATGFTFLAQTPAALQEAVGRAVALYRQEPAGWLRLMRTGMRQDWSWDRLSVAYEQLYEKLANNNSF